MLKVFGRKKSSAAPTPTPTPSSSSRIVSAPRALGSAPPPSSTERPPPLYARFATRGESFDSASTSFGPIQRPSKLQPDDSSLRGEYARQVQTASRVYGSESVTRFGSDGIVASPASSRRDLTSMNGDDPAPTPAPAPVKKRSAPPSRLGSQQDVTSNVKSSRRTSAVLVTQQHDDDNEVLKPPKAPALHSRTNTTNTSKSSTDSDGASLAPSLDSQRVSEPYDPDEYFNRYNPPTRPTVTKSASAPTKVTVIRREKDLPPPPPPASRPQSTVSTTPTIKPTPSAASLVHPGLRATPSAASLVHPAFKQRSASSTSASAIVHPSQRLRPSPSTLSVSTNVTNSTPTTNNAIGLSPNGITTSTLSASPVAVSPIPSAAPPSPVKVVNRVPAPPLVTTKVEVLPPPQTQTLPPRAPSPVLSVTSSTSASIQQPLPPSTPTPSSRPIETVPSPTPSPAPSSTNSSAPPSAHKPASVSAARRLSRRLSAEFGTYDIAAARKEREKLQERRQSISLTPSPAPSKEKHIHDDKENHHDFEPVPMLDVGKGKAKGKEREIGERPAEDAAKASPVAVQPPPPISISTTPSHIPTRRDSRPLPPPPSTSPSPSPQQEKPYERQRKISFQQQPQQPDGFVRSRVESNASVRRALPIPPPTQDQQQRRNRVESNAAASTRGALPPTPVDAPQNNVHPRSRNVSGETITPSSHLPLPPPTTRLPLTPAQEIVRESVSQSSSVSSAFSTTTQSTSMSVHEMGNGKIRKKRTYGGGEGRERTESMTREKEGARERERTSSMVRQQKYEEGHHHQQQQRERVPTIVAPEEEAEPEAVEEPAEEEEEEKEPTYYPLQDHLLTPSLLAPLLTYLGFREVLPLLSLSMDIKRGMEDTKDVKETVLERYLSESVGYRRWSAERMGRRKEPLALTLRDLNSYMRGISFPPHHYFGTADTFLSALAESTTTNPNGGRKPVPKHLTNQVRMMASSCRAYTKVVIRLRAQADAEAAHLPPDFVDDRGRGSGNGGGPRGKSRMPATGPGTHPPTTGPYQGLSRRSPSPAFSFTSYNKHGPAPSPLLSSAPPTVVSNVPGKFRSPLYKQGNAPLLRVFVPSPEGAWLSDSSVLECERELKRAGVIGLLKVGDVVHDLAAGDEGNTGRLIWDGNYLIDLDYSYSHLGEIPHYIDSLAFPPSYFHKIVRTSGNPVVYMDLAPFAQEIANHLQLIQDRIQTDTPQGGHHTVVRYVHRARFRIKAGTPVNINAPPVAGPDGVSFVRLIDPGWHGTIVVEAEGTNEGLADLQSRVGNGVMLFPVKNVMHGRKGSGDQWDPRMAGQPGEKSVFRLLRGQSRPGEIWLRCVREKEKIM